MFKVLLVDDERIIREGISKLIEWKSLGLILVGVAKNGVEAYEMVRKYVPDIVITDIKMPEMDGLELIASVKKQFEKIKFIVLSGYGEFDFAAKAMKYGVKDYLLKPCSKEMISEVLKNVLDEIKEIEEKDRFSSELENNLNKVLPQVKEQFFRDFLTLKTYEESDCEFFKKLFNISDSLFRLIVFGADNKTKYIEKFALKNIIDKIFGEDIIVFNTIIGENVSIVIKNINFNRLSMLLNKIKAVFIDYYKINIYAAVSEEGILRQMPALYKEALECLEYRFYLSECTIITKDDVCLNKNSSECSLDIDYNKMEVFLRSGNYKGFEIELNNFFQQVMDSKLDIDIAKSYCMALYLSVARQERNRKSSEYLADIKALQEMDTLKLISDLILKKAKKIAELNYEENSNEHGKLVNKIIECVKENIGNKELSLSWIAEKILYMNVDYLGKLFKKEMNEKFSQYVMRLRMEKAKYLIENEAECKLYEIADKIGIQNNPQYFSQLFKKYTGFTPTEYRMMRQKKN